MIARRVHSMYWFQLWDSLKYGYWAEGTLSDKQKLFLEKLKQNVQTLSAIKARSQKRYALGKYANNTSKRGNNFSPTGIRGKAIYPEAAKYFEVHYGTNCKKRKKPKAIKAANELPKAHNFFEDGLKVTETKRTNKLNARCAVIVKKVLNAQADSLNFENVIFTLYAQIGLSAFSDDEKALFREIKDFAVNVPIEFKAVKRSNRRVVETFTMTYKEFCEWYAENEAEYSCIQRCFIPLFSEYERKKGNTYSSKKVDELIRYDAYPECFTSFDRLSFNEDFFSLMKQIRETGKKK